MEGHVYSQVQGNLDESEQGRHPHIRMVRRCIIDGEEATSIDDNATVSQSFVGIWEQVIHDLRTEDGGVRFTTAESYECSLKSFRKILGENAIKGFCISAAELQKWKDGMHNGVKDEMVRLSGKSATLRPVFICVVAVPYGTGVCMRATSKMFLIPFLTRKRKAW